MQARDWLLAQATEAVPGVLGSLVASLFFHQATWPRRFGMFLAGSAIAHYGGPWAAERAGLDLSFAGFLLGLFGMAFVEKVYAIWDDFDLGSLLRDAVRKKLGLAPKE